MQINVYATLRPISGSKLVELALPEGSTVRQMVAALAARYPAMGEMLLDSGGQLFPHVHVFINGRDTNFLDQAMETPLTPADTIDIFPAVAGG